ncbi:MAG TPA: CHASE3 domain-containing protein [Saprospiraceae bacterium]|nr:CHASE3 domain-containing protein [Saprospiraceae bacterium]
MFLNFHFLGLTKAEKKILFAVFSILTAMCTMAYIAHKKSQQLIKSAEAIEYSEEIKFHIQDVQSILVNMESGVRGYVVTGDESYMTPANEAISSIFVHLHELGSLPGITPAQTNQIENLKKLLDEKSNLTTRTAELRRQKGRLEAIAFMSEGKEKELMHDIRGITGKMIADEDAKLTELKTKNRSAISHFAITFYLLVLKISITVITVIVLFMLYLRQRNKAEKILKESQELFYDVLDHTASIISIKDLTGRYILINKAFEKLLGTPRESVKNNTVYDLFDKEVANSIRNTDLEVIRQLQQIKVDEIIPYEGEHLHYVSLKFPLFDSNHIPYAICSISTDETEKMRSDHHHKQEMNRILDLFNNAPCGYQSTDSNGMIIEINETLLKWLGYRRHEVVGKIPVRDLVSPESQHQLQYYFPRLMSGEVKSLFDVEATYIRKNGSKFTIIANSIGVYDDDGNFLYTRTSVFDISYRKRVEEIATNN